MQQPAFVTQTRLSLCSKPSSDSISVGALESVSDMKAGCNHCMSAVFLASPASPGGWWGSTGSDPALPTEGPGLQRCDVTPSKEQGKEEAKGSVGDCGLPFLIGKSLNGKDFLWSLAVHIAPKCLGFQ